MKTILAAILSLFLAWPVLAAVNINTAPQSELESLPGIGPAKSRAIIEHREKNGPFKSVDELARVKGIGKTTVERLRTDITVSTTPQTQKKH